MIGLAYHITSEAMPSATEDITATVQKASPLSSFHHPYLTTCFHLVFPCCVRYKDDWGQVSLRRLRVPLRDRRAKRTQKRLTCERVHLVTLRAGERSESVRGMGLYKMGLYNGALALNYILVIFCRNKTLFKKRTTQR